MNKIEEYNRKACFSELKQFCTHASENDYMELTEWENGEGFDVSISSKEGNQLVQLTWGEFEALTALAAFIS